MNIKEKISYRMIEEYILGLIKDGQVNNGDYLPPLREIGKKFKVSQYPVLQATENLVKKGLLKKVPGRGTLVTYEQPVQTLTNRIGVLYPSTGGIDFAFYTDRNTIINGIDLEAQKEEKMLLSHAVPLNKPSVAINRKIKDLARDVDGFILVDVVPEFYEIIKGTLAEIKKPVVLVDYPGTDDGFDCVLSDHAEDTRKVVAFLVGLGHTRIGCVYAKTLPSRTIDHPNGITKREALKSTLEKHGIPLNENYVCTLAHSENIQPFKDLMAQPNPPTAIFCLGDYWASVVLENSKKLNIAVPDQLSVIGYYGVSEAALYTPSLTTVDVPRLQMGRAAVRMVMERLNEDPHAEKVPYKKVFEGKLVERNSHKRI